jgi:hypothetical protein
MAVSDTIAKLEALVADVKDGKSRIKAWLLTKPLWMQYAIWFVLGFLVKLFIFPGHPVPPVG